MHLFSYEVINSVDVIVLHVVSDFVCVCWAGGYSVGLLCWLLLAVDLTETGSGRRNGYPL